MEIIDVSKDALETLENAEKALIHPDAETCTTYELRLSRVIGILQKIKKKKSGIKAMFNPELPEIKTVEESSLDEIYSYTEGILGEFEKKILEHDQNLQELKEKTEIINF